MQRETPGKKNHIQFFPFCEACKRKEDEKRKGITGAVWKLGVVRLGRLCLEGLNRDGIGLNARHLIGYCYSNLTDDVLVNSWIIVLDITMTHESLQTVR